MQKPNLDYSKKIIAVLPKQQYKIIHISKIEKLITRIRWKVSEFYFLYHHCYIVLPTDQSDEFSTSHP